MADNQILDIQPFAYGDKAIIKGLTLDLSLDRVAIVGPSGCGKTTLLHLLAGLIPNLEQDYLSQYQLSMMFQEPRLMPWLTVTQNLQLVAPSLTEENINLLLEAVNLEQIGHLYPKALSGGMQRRVALARAFAVKPEMILLDEPFISLDVPTANECRELLIKLQQHHQSKYILVTHDLDEAIALSDVVYFLTPRPCETLLIIYPHQQRKEGMSNQEITSQLISDNPHILSGMITKL